MQENIKKHTTDPLWEESTVDQLTRLTRASNAKNINDAIPGLEIYLRFTKVMEETNFR